MMKLIVNKKNHNSLSDQFVSFTSVAIVILFITSISFLYRWYYIDYSERISKQKITAKFINNYFEHTLKDIEWHLHHQSACHKVIEQDDHDSNVFKFISSIVMLGRGTVQNYLQNNFSIPLKRALKNPGKLVLANVMMDPAYNKNNLLFFYASKDGQITEVLFDVGSFEAKATELLSNNYIGFQLLTKEFMPISERARGYECHNLNNDNFKISDFRVEPYVDCRGFRFETAIIVNELPLLIISGNDKSVINLKFWGQFKQAIIYLLVFIILLVIAYYYFYQFILRLGQISEFASDITRQSDKIVIPSFEAVEFKVIVNHLKVIHETKKNLRQKEHELCSINANLSKTVAARTKELQLSLQRRNEFFDNISHEIRTPVQGIHIFTKSLIENWHEWRDEYKYDVMKKANKASERLFDLIRNMLDLSKIESNLLAIDTKIISLNRIISDVVLEFNDLGFDSKSRIKFDIDNTPEYYIKGDQIRIEQVIRNLLDNALKYSEKEVIVTIEAKKIAKRHVAKIMVTDKGIGIPPSDLETIFMPFQQSHLTKTKGSGFGLGLSICAKIIKLHGGEIWAENYNNAGARVTVQLDYLKDFDHQVYLTKNSKSLHHLVVIDDEAICLDTIKLLLSEDEFILSCFECPQKGTDYITSNIGNIDAIILDIMMPGENGLMLLKRLRAIDNLTAVPVLLQSGIADFSEIAEEVKSLEAVFIRKPYTKDELMAKLSEILELKSNNN